VAIAASAVEHLETSWQKWFPVLIVTTWVLTPEVRRLIDWQIGFNSLSIITLLPIIVLLPAAGIFVRRQRLRIPRDFGIVVALWSVGFLYAFLVAWLSGGIFGGTFELMLFCAPLLLALWLTSKDPLAARRAFDRFAGAALWLGVTTSVYGIYQFIAPPPWDVAWADNSGLGSIGQPVPFGLRIFGTMNSPGVLSDFLAMVILLTLHRLERKTMWLLAPLLLCTVALALTFGRTGWLELAVGFVVYIILSPRRATALMTVLVVSLLTFGLATNLSLITGDPTSNSAVTSRLLTFNDIGEDDSAMDRQRQSSIALRQAMAEPLGQGLGTEGTATKLSSSASTTVLDNGDLTRLLEMGDFGFLLYILSLVGGLTISLARLPAAYAVRHTDSAAAPLIATAIGIQVALLGADLSGDHHSALMAVVFWLVIGLMSTMPRERPRGELALSSLSRDRHLGGPAPA
jgi:putative inorganic carbon (HCO3(-)) transporter